MGERLGPLERRSGFFWIFFGDGKFSEKFPVEIVWGILEDGRRAWEKIVREGRGVSVRPWTGLSAGLV
jgi:hypothetical protein